MSIERLTTPTLRLHSLISPDPIPGPSTFPGSLQTTSAEAYSFEEPKADFYDPDQEMYDSDEPNCTFCGMWDCNGDHTFRDPDGNEMSFFSDDKKEARTSKGKKRYFSNSSEIYKLFNKHTKVSKIGLSDGRNSNSVCDGPSIYACTSIVNDKVSFDPTDHTEVTKFYLSRRNKGFVNWIMDSGATYHCTNALTNFLYYEELAEAETASTAKSNADLLILGSGTVVIEHDVFVKPETINKVKTLLYPVLYIPNLSTRLISMGCLLKQGLSIEGESGIIRFRERNQIRMTCTPVIPSDTIYWVNSRISNRIKLNAVLNDESYEIWHQRMGHISHQAISHLHKQVKNGPEMEHLKPSNI